MSLSGKPWGESDLPFASLGTIHSGGIDDGFIEFSDVDLCGGRVDGVRNPGGLWDSSRGIRASAPAAAAFAGKGG